VVVATEIPGGSKNNQSRDVESLSSYTHPHPSIKHPHNVHGKIISGITGYYVKKQLVRDYLGKKTLTLLPLIFSWLF